MSAWRAAIAGMDEAPLNDMELDALRFVLLDLGEDVPREAQVELLLTALWWRAHQGQRLDTDEQQGSDTSTAAEPQQ